jgi:hypothetical protein
MSDEYPETCIRPNLDDWNVLVSQHEAGVRQDYEATSARVTDRFQDLALRRPEKDTRDAIPDLEIELDLSKNIPWTGEVTDNIVEDSAKQSLFRDFVPERYCPTSFIWPPYPWCSPATPHIVRPGPTKYARSLALAEKNGRIEVGAAAVPYESVAVVGDLRISTAAASVTAAKAVTPITKPTTATVYADALVNALFGYMAAGPKLLFAGINVDLVLAITTFKGGIKSVRERRTIYNSHGYILSAYVDKLSAQKFGLSASTDLLGADYLIASLSVEATTIAEKERINSGVAAIVDIEGYQKPPGEVPYFGGSVFVPGFLIKTCEKS